MDRERLSSEYSNLTHIFSRYPHELNDIHKVLKAADLCKHLGTPVPEWKYLQRAEKLDPNNIPMLERTVNYIKRWLVSVKDSPEDSKAPLVDMLEDYKCR